MGATELQMNDHDISSFFPGGQHPRFNTLNYNQQEPSPFPTSPTHPRNMNPNALGHFYNHSDEEERRRNTNNATFRANSLASSTQSSLRFLDNDIDFASLTPGQFRLGNVPTKSRNNFDLSEAQSRSSRASITSDGGYNTTPHPSHRLSGSMHRPLSGTQDRALQSNGQEDQLLTRFHKMDLQVETMPQDFSSRFQTPEHMQRTAVKTDRPLEAGFSRPKYHSGSDDMGLAGQLPASSDGTAEIGYPFPTDYSRSTSFSDRESSSPVASDHRRGLSSPFYSRSSGTPSTVPESVRTASGSALSNHTSNGQMVMLDRESIGSRPFPMEEQYTLSNTSHARVPYSQPYGFEGYLGSLRLNPLALPYPLPAYHGLTNPYPSRYPSREHDSSQIIRSALLEDFRANHKTSKRYELKVSQVITFEIPSH